MRILRLLTFAYSLAFGMDSGAFWQYYPEPAQYYALNYPLFIDLEAEISLGPVFVGGGTRTEVYANSLFSYDPFQDTYAFRAGLRFPIGDTLLLEGGYVHTCYHPRNAYDIIEEEYGQLLAVPRYEGATDRVYIMIRGTAGRK